MPISIEDRLIACRTGNNPALICQVPSGWVTLCNMQYLRGYCILQADPPVGSLNDASIDQRVQFMLDMARVGDALLAVTGAYRINYAIMGNTEPVLHAHIVPRYDWEETKYRMDEPWSYPQDVKDSQLFDPARDGELIAQLTQAILESA